MLSPYFPICFLLVYQNKGYKMPEKYYKSNRVNDKVISKPNVFQPLQLCVTKLLPCYECMHTFLVAHFKHAQ